MRTEQIALREAARLSMIMIAAKAGTSERTVRRFEREQPLRPASIRRLEAVYRALAVEATHSATT